MNNIQLIRKLFLSTATPIALGAKHLLIGQTCLLCNANSDQPCCGDCAQALPTLPQPHCPNCAYPLQHDRCPACAQHPLSIDRTFAEFAYDYPLNHLVHAFKYQGRLELAPWFAKRLLPLAETLHTQNRVDAIIAMPLHPNRLRYRGYNQSHEIAQRIADALHITCKTGQVHRLMNTRPQVELSLAQRRQLPKMLFASDAQFHQQHILLIDDVLTTGSSLNTLAHTVRSLGAKRVSCLVVARTLFH